MREFCLVHLADLHIDDIEDTNFTLLREELKSDIKKVMIQNELQIDMIAVTGDIVNKGKLKSYDLAKELFEGILEELCLEKQNMVFVPGNHDISRDSELEEKLEKYKVDIDKIGFINNQWTEFNDRFSAFERFTSHFYDNSTENINGSFGVRDIEVNGVKVRFVLLNTSWTTMGNTDYGRLRISRAQLEYLREVNARLGHCDLAIALTHHPLEWLEHDDKEMVEDYLMNKSKIGVDVILHGHIHDARIEMNANPNRSILKLVSGIGYPKSKERAKGQPKIGGCRYSIYKFGINNNCVEIVSRISNSQGVFHPDNGLYRCEGEDGRYFMPLTIQEGSYALSTIQTVEGDNRMRLGTGLVNVVNETSVVVDALWTSPNGLTLPKTNTGCQVLGLAQQLKPREIQMYHDNYQSEYFEAVAEGVWLRALTALREKVLGFGESFVAEMVGVEDLRYVRELPAFEVINIAVELGFINQTGKMRLMHASEIVQHYLSEGVQEEMPQNEVDTVIRASIQYVLGYDNTHMKFEYGDFRERLKTNLIEQTPETLNVLKGGPYFYKKTTIRTVINLMKEAKAGEFDIVVANMISIFTTIWDDLDSEDKYLIGLTYAQYANEGNVKLIKPLKSILLKVHGFDYVPENLRSFTFIEAAKGVISAHSGANNFYNEPSAVSKLERLGSVIPKHALKACISAILMVKLGNSYNICWDAQSDANKILSTIQPDDWKYYLDKCLPMDKDILWKISAYDKRTEHWMNVVNDYNLHEIGLSNKNISKMLIAAKDRNKRVTSGIASELYDSIK